MVYFKLFVLFNLANSLFISVQAAHHPKKGEKIQDIKPTRLEKVPGKSLMLQELNSEPMSISSYAASLDFRREEAKEEEEPIQRDLEHGRVNSRQLRLDASRGQLDRLQAESILDQQSSFFQNRGNRPPLHSSRRIHEQDPLPRREDDRLFKFHERKISEGNRRELLLEESFQPVRTREIRAFSEENFPSSAQRVQNEKGSKKELALQAKEINRRNNFENFKARLQKVEQEIDKKKRAHTLENLKASKKPVKLEEDAIRKKLVSEELDVLEEDKTLKKHFLEAVLKKKQVCKIERSKKNQKKDSWIIYSFLLEEGYSFKELLNFVTRYYPSEEDKKPSQEEQLIELGHLKTFLLEDVITLL